MPSILQSELTKLNAQKTWVEEKIAEIEARIAAADALAGPHMRALAVELHKLLCPLDHNPGGTCSWNSEDNANDPDSADWTAEAHALWMERAKAGVAKMKELGFTVEDPT